jgi:SsrA-binding protein
MEIRNRKINDYEVESTLCAGLVLVGMEIKSLVKKEIDITGSRCMIRFSDSEKDRVKSNKRSKKHQSLDVYLVGAYIKVLESNFAAKYEANRDRLLLLKKSELHYIQQELQKNRVVIPVRVFRAESGKYKVEIAVCRPLKKYDKREKEKEKMVRKELGD